MKRNLESRLARLEDARCAGELPNGGILLVCVEDGQSRDDALRQRLEQPDVLALAAAQRRRLTAVFLNPEDMNA